MFSRGGLERALGEAGFRVLSWHRVFESYLITAMALGLKARARLPRPAADLVWAVLHSRPLRWAMAPVFRIVDAVLGGSSVTVVAAPIPDAGASRAPAAGAARVPDSDASPAPDAGAAPVPAP